MTDQKALPNRKRFIVDIDGTVANHSHRVHFIVGDKKQWDLFYEACDMDLPYRDMCQLVDGLAKLGYEPIYLTGRPERVRGKTEDWMRRHSLPWAKVVMRANQDWRSDIIVKAEMADRNGLTPENVFFALEDRDQVVGMWRSRGIRCLQVRKGDF